MNPAEYDRMAALEETHWWYAGVRDLFSRLLKRPRFSPPDRPRVLDAGCGSGAHLQMFQSLLNPSYLGGFDLSPLAVGHARQKNPQADVYEGDLCHPEIRTPDLDLLFCCDVLYTTPLDEGTAGLKTLTRTLRPGGLLLLHLPAYNWLRSRHDLAVHTRQRFTTSSARKLLELLDLRVELLSYRMSVLFPALVARRAPSLLFRRHEDSGDVVSDLAATPPLMNRVLESALKAENRIISCGIPLPFGSSIVAVGRKP
ncbi:trans-aconitate 2-methyltransferase [Caulifigura coniformis]|uniref:Trans-aconitate 2-methyltransferase n=1 Tax=Caulifigura coniformis TaxID=2527983 RepID=A0A517SKN3_9PLAN|nr:class I SAM-dependent methyltransferase [Caulifigura coniformis]QDT56685.1 trans-aconitate 2-methyltransferase [Caulifigura coniformis]